MESKKWTIMTHPPSEETKTKMAEFFMKTSIPRILAERKAEEEAKRKTEEEGE